MFKDEAWTGFLALLLSVLILCSCFETPIQTDYGALSATASETMPTDIPNSFITYRHKYYKPVALDNSQVIRQGALSNREPAGNANNEQRFAIIEQVLLACAFESFLLGSYSGIVTLGSKRISVLALSLGGNSPPAFHF